MKKYSVVIVDDNNEFKKNLETELMNMVNLKLLVCLIMEKIFLKIALKL